MTRSYQLEWVLGETVAAFFKVLSWHFCGWNEGNHDKSRYSLCTEQDSNPTSLEYKAEPLPLELVALL
jgi:hypothetical protein